MENFLNHVDSIAQAGSIVMPVDPEVRIPMVTTRDIGAAAAERLLDENWTGIHHLGVHGPANLSHNEAAEAITTALGREVKFVQVPKEAAIEAMVGLGLPDGFVEEMLELYDGLNRGTMQPAERRTEKATTPTTLEAWAAEVLKPLVDNKA